MNKQETFDVKLILIHTDIVIFALGHFILPHPVNAAILDFQVM